MALNEENETPLVEDEPGLMAHVRCVGCGTREGVRTLVFKTSYGSGRNDRQAIPYCEMCSIKLGLQLFHIWNSHTGGAA